jgi:hypothetical protein
MPGIEIALYKYINYGGYDMRCQRCGGRMTYEKFYGSAEEFFGWRCIFCGEIVDTVILENRLEQKR